MKVATVQMRSTRSLAENLSAIANSLYKCAKRGARKVAFPECALSGYFGDAVTKLPTEQITAAEERVAEACRAAGIHAVVGTAWRDGDLEPYSTTRIGSIACPTREAIQENPIRALSAQTESSDGTRKHLKLPAFIQVCAAAHTFATLGINSSLGLACSATPGLLIQSEVGSSGALNN